MAKTIHSLTEQNTLAALISLFQDNDKKMTIAQIREGIPGYLDFQPSQNDLDQITTVLKSYSEGPVADDAVQDPSIVTTNIFSDLGDETYQLNGSEKDAQQFLNRPSFSADLKTSVKTTQQKDHEIKGSSESSSMPQPSLETFDSFAETTVTQNQINPNPMDLKHLEKHLNDAGTSVQEAEDRAASLKIQGTATYEEITTNSSDSSVERARQHMSEAYQKRMEAFQQRVNELQEALDAALHEKELAQNDADRSGMDAYKLQQEMQSTVDSKEETIRKYRHSAQENQKHIDELQKALAEAKESLENAQLSALATEQEMQSVRDKANAYYAYGNEKINDYQNALDSCQKQIGALQGELDESAQAKDQMTIMYQQDLQEYQAKIRDLQKALADFTAQADSLKSNVDSLKADKEETYRAYQQNIDSYCSEIGSLEEDLRASQQKLAEAATCAQANGQEADALRQQTASFQSRLGDLEDRLNAALKAFEAARAQANEADAQNQSLKQDLNDLNVMKEQMIHSYSQDKDDWKIRMDKMQEALMQASQKLADTTKRADASEAQAGSLKQNLENQLNSREKMLASHCKEINLFKNQICALKKALSDSNHNASTAQAEAQASRQDQEDLRNQIDTLQQKIRALQQELDSSLADLDAARGQADEAKTQTQGMQNSLNGLNIQKDQILAAWKKDTQDYQAQIAQLKAEMEKLNGSLKNADARAAKTEADNASLRQNAADFAALRDQMTDTCNQKLASSQLQIESLKNQLDASQKNVDGLQADLDAYNGFKDEMIRSYQEDMDGYQNQIANLKKALSSSQEELADARDHANAAQSEANDLKQKAGQLEASKKQMLAASKQNRDHYALQIDALQNRLKSLQAALEDSDHAVSGAQARAEKAQGENKILENSIDTLKTEKERIAADCKNEIESLHGQIAQLQRELDELRIAMQKAQDRADASEKALTTANARADCLENKAELYSSSLTDINNAYTGTIGDYQDTLNGIQAELDKAYQAVHDTQQTFSNPEVQEPESCQAADEMGTQSFAASGYDIPDPIDIDIQLAQDKIARQQQKILDHRDSIHETSSDFMKAVYQAEINHNKNVINRQTQKLADLQDEKMKRNR